MEKIVKFYRIYKAPVEWKTGKVQDAVPTDICFKNKEDADLYCEDNRKINLLYTNKPEELKILTCYEKQKSVEA